MAAKKTTRAKSTRKVTRAKATKKTSVRSGRKAPGKLDPMGRIAVPRFLGGVISVPLLTAVFNSVGILGAYFVGVRLMGVDNGAFWSQMQEYVGSADVREGVVKSIIFGVAASLIAVFEGYTAEPTAEGVALATTRTVVITSVLVLILDYMITAFLL